MGKATQAHEELAHQALRRPLRSRDNLFPFGSRTVRRELTTITLDEALSILREADQPTTVTRKNRKKNERAAAT